jgi:hypothetical protein
MALPIEQVVGITVRNIAEAGNNAVHQIESYGTKNVQFSQLIFRTAGGLWENPTQTLSGSTLGVISGVGFHNAGLFGVQGGQVYFKATEDYTATAQGQMIGVVTTPNGTTSPITTALFTQSGGLAIGSQTGTDPGPGGLALHPGSSITPTANGDLIIQATSNTSLTFKYKGSDGVVRSGSIALS